MSGLSDVVIKKISALNREAANDDRVSCLVCGGVTIVEDTPNNIAGADLNTLLGPFYSVEDAEKLGITAAYDSANHLLIHHHISEYFRGYGESVINRPAKPLYLYMVSQSTPLSVMCDKDSDYGIYQAWLQSDREIKRFGVVLNPDSGYSADTATNGFDADVVEAVTKAEEAATLMHDEHGPVHVYLEGRDFVAQVAGDAIDLHLDAENVSIIFAQDYDIAQSHSLHNGYAAIGTYLGMVCSKPTLADAPSEVGFAYQGNVQDKAAGSFLNYGFGNRKLSAYSIATQNALADKGYIVVRTFAKVPGVYFSQSYTCALSTSDYDRSELNEVYNKANRGIYAAYVPLINTKIKLADDGSIPGNTAKALEALGDAVLNRMVAKNEISAGKTYIDPKQLDDSGNATSLAVTRNLKVKWRMVPMGKAEQIEGTLGFTVSIE